MNNNDVLHALSQILVLNNTAITDIFRLAKHNTDELTVAAYLTDASDSSFLQCSDMHLTQFLDGLITHRRGPGDKEPLQPRQDFPALTNNSIFKKIRIAFDLQEDDLIELMSFADYEVTKNELSTIFRKPGHKHYRACSDEFLMAFLTGLTFRQWD